MSRRAWCWPQRSLVSPGLSVAQAADSETALRASKVNALHLLRGLKTAPERNANYDRDKFADWIDKDRDGCDTRAEVLIAESLKRVRKGSGCYVRTGKWFSKYDGLTFKRATNLDIDHMVPLAEAWGAGAKKWNNNTRGRFSNDLAYRYSLIAVSASSNRSKSDSDPSEWMPPRKRFHCDYAKQYTAVKWRWNLKVNKAERTKLRRTMKGCGDNSIIKPHRADIDKKGSGGGGGGDCDPNYSGACIPIVNHDLDCSDIPDRNFRVIGRDIHNFDGDGDGIACES